MKVKEFIQMTNTHIILDAICECCKKIERLRLKIGEGLPECYNCNNNDTAFSVEQKSNIMSLTDSAEYWQKDYRIYNPNGFRHAKGLECGHNHNVETEYFKDVDCHACKKIINEKRPDNLLDGEAPEFYYYSKTKAKKMRKAKKQREEFNNKYGVCECGCDLVLRTNKIQKKQFLGCSTYPNCKKTKNI